MRRAGSSRRTHAPVWLAVAEAAAVLVAVAVAEATARRRAREGVAHEARVPGSDGPYVARGMEPVAVADLAVADLVVPDLPLLTTEPGPSAPAATRILAGAVAVLLLLGVVGVVLDRGRNDRRAVAAPVPHHLTVGQEPDDLLANIRLRPETPVPAPVAPAPAPPPAAPAPPVVTPAPAPMAVAAPVTSVPPDLPARLAARSLRAADRLPTGKGIWMYNWDNSEGGDPAAIVAKATAVGLSHVYVRLGDSRSGFYGGPYLDRFLPVAHAAGLDVIGWDFPFLGNADEAADRAAAEIAYRTPGGHGIDGFSADVETPAEGTNLSAATVIAYSTRLRTLAGPQYPLIATVPRPNAARGFPFAEVARSFDAFAPMVYWMNRDPAVEVAAAVDALAVLGKPVLPVGQAYDGAVDGGPPGPPSKDALTRFITTATDRGATGYSFWSWQTATPDHWAAVSESRAPGRSGTAGPPG